MISICVHVIDFFDPRTKNSHKYSKNSGDPYKQMHDQLPATISSKYVCRKAIECVSSQKEQYKIKAIGKILNNQRVNIMIHIYPTGYYVHDNATTLDNQERYEGQVPLSWDMWQDIVIPKIN